ncbi:ABC transporter ATP-binding protein [Chryseobacterium sp. T1]
MKQTKTLWFIISPIRKKINWAMFLSCVSSFSVVLNLVLMSYLINALFNNEKEMILYYFIGMLICTTIAYYFRLKAFDVSHYAAFHLEAVLRKKIAKHLAILPLGYIMEHGSGALTKVLNEDVRQLHGFAADSTPLFARTYAFPIFTLLALFWFDYRVALICLGILIIGLSILSFVMKNNKEISQKFNKRREAINVSVIEYVQAMPVVRVFDGGEKSFSKFDNALNNFLEIIISWYKQNGLGAKLSMLILNPLPTFIILLIVGTYWYTNNQISFLGLIGALLLGTGMMESILPYRSLMNIVLRSEISAKRIDELLNVQALKEPENNNLIPQDSSIKFENVSFTYEGRDDKALDNLAFQVLPNTFTAITGSSGAGKSTIARLIPRFWDIQEGSIKIGNIDIRDLKSEILLNHLSFVFQDSFIFSDTVANNIKMGNEDATLEQIIEAAKSAQIHDEIMNLPLGYDTLLQERANNFSGGQKQRLAIARAILRDNPILVLDEATSFSDTENEYQLMQAFKNLMKNKTVVMIAHRLETIKNADQILVIEKGKIAEQGNHESLIKANGNYTKMWESYHEARNWHIKASSL